MVSGSSLADPCDSTPGKSGRGSRLIPPHRADLSDRGVDISGLNQPAIRLRVPCLASSRRSRSSARCLVGPMLPIGMSSACGDLLVGGARIGHQQPEQRLITRPVDARSPGAPRRRVRSSGRRRRPVHSGDWIVGRIVSVQHAAAVLTAGRADTHAAPWSPASAPTDAGSLSCPRCSSRRSHVACETSEASAPPRRCARATDQTMPANSSTSPSHAARSPAAAARTSSVIRVPDARPRSPRVNDLGLSFVVSATSAVIEAGALMTSPTQLRSGDNRLLRRERVRARSRAAARADVRFGRHLAPRWDRTGDNDQPRRSPGGHDRSPNAHYASEQMLAGG